MSRKPSVTMSAVRAPRPSRMELVATVVACRMRCTSAGCSFSVARPSAWTKQFSSAAGVVSTLCSATMPPRSSMRTTSVKVPPISMPTLYFIGAVSKLCRQLEGFVHQLFGVIAPRRGLGHLAVGEVDRQALDAALRRVAEAAGAGSLAAQHLAGVEFQRATLALQLLHPSAGVLFVQAEAARLAAAERP